MILSCHVDKELGLRVRMEALRRSTAERHVTVSELLREMVEKALPDLESEKIERAKRAR